MSPGWTLGWNWPKKEVIWSIVGSQTTEQGDCSKFKGNVPHCCKRDPVLVDLLPGVPYNQQFSNCCKGGVLASWGEDPSESVSSFQISVGLAGTSNKTVKLPKNFTLLGPGPGYTCGPAKIVPSTVFLTADHRRKTQALSKLTFLCFCFFLCSSVFLSGWCNIYLQWHGMWHAPIHSFCHRSTRVVVFLSQLSTTTPSLLARLVLVVATINTTASCRYPLHTLRLSINVF